MQIIQKLDEIARPLPPPLAPSPPGHWQANNFLVNVMHLYLHLVGEEWVRNREQDFRVVHFPFLYFIFFLMKV